MGLLGGVEMTTRRFKGEREVQEIGKLDVDVVDWVGGGGRG
jgi:hypothetical protein